MRILISIALLLSLATAAFAASETPRPYVFGINVGMSERNCEMARVAGCKSARIGCGWDLVEKEPGVYDWSEVDQDVNMCLKYGFEPFFLVVATPKFYLEENMRDKPWGWPALPQYYPQAEKFYRTLAERYKGKVKYFEFWNEPNGWSWHAINSPEDYGPILKLAYKSLKEGNPDCLVAVGGLDGGGWKGYYKFLEKLYDLGYGDCFDAVGAHPYRWEGPIDAYSLKKIHQVLVDHGDGDRKLWLTEYGWSNEYGHDNKARWLKESLDLLTNPELDFVFQASIHTLTDFDGTEFGLCKDAEHPRAAYYVFKDYPKDWNKVIEMRNASKPANQSSLPFEDFENGSINWIRYGDGMRLRTAEDAGIPAESGNRLIFAQATDKPLQGGVYRVIKTTPGVPVKVDARGFTDQKGTDARNSRLRVGIDPTGGTDPKADTVIWGRLKDTSGVWDSIGCGLGNPIIAKSDKVTVFLDYTHQGGAVNQISAFDNVQITACEDTFKLPEVPK